jgi:CrcB protein
MSLRPGTPDDLRAWILVGFLGGFTTFSAYCLESVYLIEHGQLALAATYLFGSPVLGVLGAGAGMALVRALA